jgi:hypothetical protein
MTTSLSGGGSRSTRKKPPIMGKQLVLNSADRFVITITYPGVYNTFLSPLYTRPFFACFVSTDLYFLLTYKEPGASNW